MPDGYARAAMSLASLSSDDRHWLLSQLAEDDRARILASLQQVSTGVDDSGAPVTVTVGTHRAGVAALSNPDHMDRDDHNVVDDADVDSLTRLLQDEPDWLIAVLLTHAEWSWTGAFMESCSSQRLERITAAMKLDAAAVKPRVRYVILSGLANRLRQRPQVQPPSSPFERILSLAERKMARAPSQNEESA